jgi:chemotaxis protein MotA
MKATTVVGMAVAFFGLSVGATMEGSALPAFLNLPAFIIVMSGTLGAVLAGTSFERMKAIPSLYKRAIAGNDVDLDLDARAQMLVSLAERARREGLLALDEELASIDDEFTRKGLQLVVDGTDAEVVAEVLEIETEALSARHAAARGVFKDAGGYAPTIGIIGTVMGLVHVLQNLANPETLGPAISGAFIATLYGVGSANLVFLPVANRLKQLSAAEVELRMLTIDGILGIQAGDNPRILSEKLRSFIPPAERASAAERPAAGRQARSTATPAAEAA